MAETRLPELNATALAPREPVEPSVLPVSESPQTAPSRAPHELEALRQAAYELIASWVEGPLLQAESTVRGIAHRIDEDPRDLGQTVLERLLRTAQKTPDQVLAIDNPGGFLRMGLLNGVKDRRRHEGIVDAHHETLKANREAVTTPEPQALLPIANVLKAIVSQLPQRQRAVIYLRYYADLSDEQIAATLNMQVGTVKAHGNRGRTSLKKLLNAVGIGSLEDAISP